MKKLKEFLEKLGTVFLHLSVIALLFLLISSCSWLWLRVSLFLLLGVLVLIDLVFLFFEGKAKTCFVFSKVFMSLGIIFGVAFGIWLINFGARLLNVFFWFFDSELRIGWVFNEIWNIIFSPIGLLAGAIFFVAGLVMNANDAEEKVYQEKLARRKLSATRREAEAAAAG